MSDFKFNCPHCKQSLEAPEEMLGQQINCPSCNGAIQLPSPQRPPQPPPQTGKKIVINKTPQPQQSGGTTKPCPFCGEQIMATAIKCKHCGEMLSQTAGAGKPKGGSKLKKVCKWIMIVWSIFCLGGVIIGLVNAGKEMPDGMGEFEQAGAAIGMGCGMAIWIIAWAVIVLPALIVWLVAGKKND